MGENANGTAPDLASVVQLILQNPALMEQLQTLVKSAPKAEPAEIAENIPEREDLPAAAVKPEEKKWMNGKREHLLCALKPYLSKERAGAIDAAVNFARILDTVHTK